MKTVHQEVSEAAGAKGKLKEAAQALVAKHGRNRVLEAASDMSFSSLDPRVNERIDRMIALVERMPSEMTPVRRNFGSLFGKKHDLAQHAEKARVLARPHRPTIEHFLVHAPGKGGRGEAWYWLNGLQERDFEEAPSSFSPKRYLTGDKPWAQLRSTLSDYGKYVRPAFIVIDTFTERVEGPLTEDSIAARNNPDMQALRAQARQHLTLVQREGKKAAKQAGVLARQAKESAHDTALEAQVKALQTTFDTLDLYCEGGDPRSGALDRLSDKIEERQLAKRGTQRIARRNPSAALQGRLMELLSTLFTIKNYAWTAHWNARGASFYGDHLLLERIYEKMDKSIDALGERVLAYTGQSVDYAELTREMARVSGMLFAQSGGSAFAHLSSLVRTAQRQSDEIRAMLSRSSGEGSTSGLDNYLTDLNDRLDTFGYLLKQREQE